MILFYLTFLYDSIIFFIAFPFSSILTQKSCSSARFKCAKLHDVTFCTVFSAPWPPCFLPPDSHAAPAVPGRFLTSAGSSAQNLVLPLHPALHGKTGGSQKRRRLGQIVARQLQRLHHVELLQRRHLLFQTDGRLF